MSNFNSAKDKIIALKQNGNDIESYKLTHNFYISANQNTSLLHQAAELFILNNELNNYIKCLHNIIQIDKSNIHSHNLLGQYYQNIGNLDYSLNHYNISIKVNPDQALIYNNIGIIKQQSGDLKLAEYNYRKAISIDHDYAQAHANIANLLSGQKRHKEAVKYWGYAAALIPDNIDIQCQLAMATRISGDMHAAEFVYKNILKYHPDNYIVNYDYISLLIRLGNYTSASMYSDKLLILFPNNIRVITQSAAIDERRGDINNGLHKLGPYIYGADKIEINTLIVYSKLSIRNRDSRLKEDTYCLIDNLLSSNRSIKHEDKVRLCFLSAKLKECLHKYDEAFDNYVIANNLHSNNFDTSFFDQYINSIINNYCDASLVTKCASSVSSKIPIFIIGMPRSGSTLLERILSSHPDIFAGGELQDIPNIARNIQEYAEIQLSYPYHSSIVSCDKLTQIATVHVSRLQKLSNNSLFVTDKMPDNFLYVGLIKQLFPNSIIIDCIRDPRDTCISCYTQHFAGDSQGYSYDLYKLISYYNNYRKLMHHWEETLGISILRVQYEDLINDPVTTSRLILSRCNLEWDNSFLEFYKHSINISTASYSQVTNPIYKSSIGRWKNYKSHISALIDNFGDSSSVVRIQ